MCRIFAKTTIFFIFFTTLLFAEQNQRIIDELASPMPEIPLKNAMGEKAYNDAMKSNKYSYVGNSKCRLCHRNFFLGRKKDPHDHTMETLAASNNEKNSHCLMCHSTGHKVPSGFVDMEQTPRLANVQCEGCHGPGNVHIQMAQDKAKNETRRFSGGGFLAGIDNPEVLKNMCISCHTKRWDRSYHDLQKAYSSYKNADPNAGH